MSKEATAVVPESNNALALFGAKTDVVPVYAQQDADKNAGNEYLNKDDLAIPVLTILQPISSEIESVEGAKAGHLYDTSTGELADKLYVMNLSYIRDYGVFRKRNRGGGFHGSFPAKEEAQAHIASLPGAAADYDIVETAKHTLLLLNKDGTPKHAILMRFKSTFLSASRAWNTEITMKNKDAPRFASVWEMSTERKSNDSGYWFAPKITWVGYAPENLFNAAKEVYQSFQP